MPATPVQYWHFSCDTSHLGLQSTRGIFIPGEGPDTGSELHLQSRAGFLPPGQQDRQVAQEDAAVARHHRALAGPEPQLVNLQQRYDSFTAMQAVPVYVVPKRRDALRLLCGVTFVVMLVRYSAPA